MKISIKFALLVLVVLFASLLTYGQGSNPAPAPAPGVQPIIEAGGLDTLCQAGLIEHYKLNDNGTFGTSGDPVESQTLSNASACIGYITGWEHAISETFIALNGRLFLVEVSDQFNAVAVANNLHAFLQANPDARTVPSPLVLLEVAVSSKVAQLSPIEFRNTPTQPQEENPAPPVSIT